MITFECCRTCCVLKRLFFFPLSDHRDLQVVSRLHGSEGVPGHHRGSAPCLPGWNSHRRWERQPGHSGARGLRGGPAGENTRPLHRHVHHHSARRQLPDLRHPHAGGYPGLLRGQRRPAALPARLPAQRAHQRAHAGPPEPAAPRAGHKHGAGPSAAPSPGLHGGACHGQVQGDPAGRGRVLPVLRVWLADHGRPRVLFSSLRCSGGLEGATAQ